MDSMSGMDGMDGSSSSSNMSGMSIVFTNTFTTPLYSLAWTPTSTGTYAATCLFLVLLAALLRGTLAFKTLQENKWIDAELDRRYVVVQGKLPLSEQLSRDSLGNPRDEKKRMDKMTLTENGVEEDVMVVRKRRTGVSPWRLGIDPARAVVDTLIAGISYLLMLAVMTCNIGYFASVLGGTFAGSLIAGRYNVAMEH